MKKIATFIKPVVKTVLVCFALGFIYSLIKDKVFN